MFVLSLMQNRTLHHSVKEFSNIKHRFSAAPEFGQRKRFAVGWTASAEKPPESSFTSNNFTFQFNLRLLVVLVRSHF
jgi:hypothetical protein